jgi:hypothetical protein
MELVVTISKYAAGVVWSGGNHPSMDLNVLSLTLQSKPHVLPDPGALFGFSG